MSIQARDRQGPSNIAHDSTGTIPHACNVEQCGVMHITATPGMSTHHLQEQFVLLALEPCAMQ